MSQPTFVPVNAGVKTAMDCESHIRLAVDIDEVHLPDGTPLWQDVRLKVPAGKNALIFGEEGCGKSVLFKALAGVWPHVPQLSSMFLNLSLKQGEQLCFVFCGVSDSQVKLSCLEQPGPNEVLFIPQHPILGELLNPLRATDTTPARQN